LGTAFHGVTGEIVAVVFGAYDCNKNVIRLTFVPLAAAGPKNHVAGRRASDMFRRGENVAQSHANVRDKLTGTHQASLPGQVPSIIVENFCSTVFTYGLSNRLANYRHPPEVVRLIFENRPSVSIRIDPDSIMPALCHGLSCENMPR
jgi:hypothetical protein